MALLLAESSIPPFMWAVVRLLAAEEKPLATDRARALLTPPSLTEGKENKAFDQALRTLRELQLIAEEKDPLSLAGHASDLDGTDFTSFSSALRQAVLAGELNVGLADDAGQTGSRDLTRILVWFLSCDPLDGPATWAIVQREQSIDLNPDAGTASRNDTRWNRFVHWAPALGLAAAPLLPTSGVGPLLPDCTEAVKQTVQRLWPVGERVNAVDAARTLRTALPVLPGGDYANAMGISDPGAQSAGAALSYALLRGEDGGWLVLQQDADAQRVLTLHDPDRPSHYVSDIVISEDQHG
ncbi:protein DpdG [Streptomyces sp. TRM75561]|uniref:protein DpdG n=1 Tax=Streptomyces sp. TRM75561 TaxID=2975269 RepID=UPI002446EBBF|nr:protein DpdG [Streptomyces sp. TRM75561]MDH3035391.1 protein DpdG [Streptomyces sp. TRM75561]